MSSQLLFLISPFSIPNFQSQVIGDELPVVNCQFSIVKGEIPIRDHPVYTLIGTSIKAQRWSRHWREIWFFDTPVESGHFFGHSSGLAHGALPRCSKWSSKRDNGQYHWKKWQICQWVSTLSWNFHFHAPFHMFQVCQNLFAAR
jgi:hypothetical protein